MHMRISPAFRWLLFLLPWFMLIGLARADSPPSNLPVGSIIGFMPDPDSREYRDMASLRRWLAGQGWALCDGTDGTPDLHGRYLQGTEQLEQVGQRIGSNSHSHRIDSETGREQGRERRFNTGVLFRMRLPHEGHNHSINADSSTSTSLPPSLRVLFIIRTH